MLKCNNRIVIYQNNKIIKGLYYGTTDEFIDVREGYYTGFFVLPMDSLRISGDSIYFILSPQTKDFFTQPLAENILSTNNAKEKGYSHWDNYDNYPFAQLRRYHGFILDSVTIFFDKDSLYNTYPRIFSKTTIVK